MRRSPLAVLDGVFQDSVSDGMVGGFADEPQRDKGPPVAGNREANCIGLSIFRETRAAGIAHVACIGQFSLSGNRAFVAGSGAASAPARA